MKQLMLLFPTILLTATLAVCAGQAAAPGSDELDAAIRETSNYLNSNLSAGKKLMILNIQSEYPVLSEYIIDELVANTVNDRVFSMVDRQQLDAIRAEQNFQMSGEVDDDSAQELGRILGAQTIISGAVSKIGDMYRLRVRALDVQSARIEGQFNRNISSSSTIALLAQSSSAGYGGGPSTPAVFSRSISSVKDYDLNLINELLGSSRAQVERKLGIKLTAVGNRGDQFSHNYGRSNAWEEIVSFAFDQAGGLYQVFTYSPAGQMQKTVNDFRGEHGEPIIRNVEGKDAYQFNVNNYSNVTNIMVSPSSINGAIMIGYMKMAAPASSGAVAIPAQAISVQASPGAYKIGDTGPAGGLIFYDKGNNSGGWRYLEAAPVEAEFQAVWRVRGTQVENTQAGIGSGKRNTQLIVDKFRQTSGEWDTAAQTADELVFNGFDDWFLPSQAELDQMYGNLKRRNLGDFKNERYWASSMRGDYAHHQYFSDGRMDDGYSNSRFYVRPIRQVEGQ